MAKPLSPAGCHAHAMTVAVTQAQYALDPEDVENEAVRIRYELAAAVKALASRLQHNGVISGADILAIAAELEAAADG